MAARFATARLNGCAIADRGSCSDPLQRVSVGVRWKMPLIHPRASCAPRRGTCPALLLAPVEAGRFGTRRRRPRPTAVAGDVRRAAPGILHLAYDRSAPRATLASAASPRSAVRRRKTMALLLVLQRSQVSSWTRAVPRQLIFFATPSACQGLHAQDAPSPGRRDCLDSIER